MIDTDFSVQFPIQMCDHMLQNGKSDCFVHMLQGELLVVCSSSPYPLGGWGVEYLYLHILEQMCLFLKEAYHIQSKSQCT